MEFMNAKTDIESCAKRAAEILRAGKVILFPTDTLYGLGADAFSDDAVAVVYAIKGRDEGKPIHCVAADMAMVGKYAEVNDLARLLAKRFFPGPLTLILKKRKGVKEGIARGIETIGIRIPDQPLCLAIARAFGKPFTATSANRSGEAPERAVGRILAQIGPAVGMIGLVLDGGELPESPPSTAVDLSGARPLILREGAIPAAEIWDELRGEY